MAASTTTAEIGPGEGAVAKRPQKARRRRLAGLSKLSGWLLRHAQVSLASLGQLSRSPLPTMMTAAVLGIALALPAGLHLLLGNLQQLAGNLSGSASISLFLHQEVSDQRARDLAQELQTWPQVSVVEVVERAQAIDRAPAGRSCECQQFCREFGWVG